MRPCTRDDADRLRGHAGRRGRGVRHARHGAPRPAASVIEVEVPGYRVGHRARGRPDRGGRPRSRATTGWARRCRARPRRAGSRRPTPSARRAGRARRARASRDPPGPVRLRATISRCSATRTRSPSRTRSSAEEGFLRTGSRRSAARRRAEPGARRSSGPRSSRSGRSSGSARARSRSRSIQKVAFAWPAPPEGGWAGERRPRRARRQGRPRGGDGRARRARGRSVTRRRPPFHPGRSARCSWRGEPAGVLGELHPGSVAAARPTGRVAVGVARAPVRSRGRGSSLPVPRSSSLPAGAPRPRLRAPRRDPRRRRFTPPSRRPEATCSARACSSTSSGGARWLQGRRASPSRSSSARPIER